jgi:hypothetical protein
MHKFVQRYRVEFLLERTHRIQPIGLEAQVWRCLGLFHYYTNFDANRAELGSLMHKFIKRYRIGIFRNERTRYTPLDPNLMFWCVLDRSITG